MWEEKIHRFRCDTCGKFLKSESGTSYLFVPESDLTYEEHSLQCRKCTDKFGPPTSKQLVYNIMCNWVYY